MGLSAVRTRLEVASSQACLTQEPKGAGHCVVGVGRLRCPCLVEDPTHLFDEFHLFERRVQRIGGRVDRVHGGVTSSLGRHARLFSRNPRRFSDLPQVFPLQASFLGHLSMLVTKLPRFLCQCPELFGLLAVVLGFLAHALGLLVGLFRRVIVVRL